MRAVGLERREIESCGGLEALAAGHPGVEAAERALQRRGLAEGAAPLRIPRRARAVRIETGDLFGGRPDAAHVPQTEMSLEAIAVSQRLDEMAAGIDEQDRRRRIDRGDEVQQHG